MSLKYGKFPHDDFINIMTSGSRVEFYKNCDLLMDHEWVSEAAAKSVVAGLIQFFILLDFDFKVILKACVTYIEIEEVVTIRYAMESAETTSQARIFCVISRMTTISLVRLCTKSFSKFMVDRRDLFVAPARTQQHATMRLEQFFRIIARYVQLKRIFFPLHSERVKYRFNNENLLLCIKLICVEIEAFSRIKCYCSFLYRELSLRPRTNAAIS